MCVIVAKVAGADFPPMNEVKNCCDTNSHGFGAMYVSKGVVKVFKTLDKTTFLTWYEKFVKKHPKSVSLVMHMRIKTHGTIKVENCHPWTDKDGQVGFAHNGILSIQNRGDMTDSETFFRDIWWPAYKLGGTKMADKATRAIIGTSRFAFLFNDGSIVRWGNWEKGSIKAGVYYTNSSWKDKSYYPSTGCWSGYYGRRYFDDDYDFDWGVSRTTSKYDKTPATTEKPKPYLGSPTTTIRGGAATVQQAMDWITTQPEWNDISKLKDSIINSIRPERRSWSFESLVKAELYSNTWSFPLANLFRTWGTSCVLSQKDLALVNAMKDRYYEKFKVPTNTFNNVPF